MRISVAREAGTSDALAPAERDVPDYYATCAHFAPLERGDSLVASHSINIRSPQDGNSLELLPRDQEVVGFAEQVIQLVVFCSIKSL